MKAKVFFLILAAVIIMACIGFVHRDHKDYKCLSCPDINSVEISYSMELTDTLNIAIQDNSSFRVFDLYKNRFLFGISNNKSNEIYIIDLLGIDTLKKICFSFDVQNIAVNSFDSIYLFTDFPPIIFLIDRNGNLLKKWSGINNKTGFKKEYKKLDLTFPVYLYYQKPLLMENEYCFLSIDFGFAFLTNKFKDIPILGMFNLENNSWNNLISLESTNYYSLINKNSHYPSDLLFPYKVFGDSNLIVSYPMDHFIYVYNTVSFSLVGKFPITSKRCTDIPKPLPSDIVNSCQKSWNFRVQTPFYGPIFYHKSVDLYSRMYHHKQNLINEEGLINSGEERNADIIIFNSNFEIVGEEYFRNGELGVFKYIPFDNGILIGQEGEHDSCHLVYKYFYSFINN